VSSFTLANACDEVVFAVIDFFYIASFLSDLSGSALQLNESALRCFCYVAWSGTQVRVRQSFVFSMTAVCLQ